MVVNEIGSEFWLEDSVSFPSTEIFDPTDYGFTGDCRYVLSGRTALDIICQDIQATTTFVGNIYMPAYCCESMIIPFVQKGFHVDFYDVILNESDGIFSEINDAKQTDILYICNYFGYKSATDFEVILKCKERGAIILYDRTHSLFLKNDNLIEIADYAFTSLRKWLEIPTGAIVSKSMGRFFDIKLKDCNYVSDKLKGMQMKYRYMQGDTSVSKALFHDYFNHFNIQLSNDFTNYQMDKISFSLLQSKDFMYIRKRRQENASYLYEQLGCVKEMKFIFVNTGREIPLFVPVLMSSSKQRESLQNALKSQNIYMPTHWPKHKWLVPNMRANEIFDREISLVCDQRYSLDEMQKVVEVIQEYNN